MEVRQQYSLLRTQEYTGKNLNSPPTVFCLSGSQVQENNTRLCQYLQLLYYIDLNRLGTSGEFANVIYCREIEKDVIIRYTWSWEAAFGFS